MARVLLGDVAQERRESIKTNKDKLPIVGLEHLIPQQIQLTEWSTDADNTFTKMFHKGDVLFGRRRAYLKKASVAPFDGICSGDITTIAPIPEKIVPELLPFIIQNDTFFDYAVGKSAGSLSPRVKWEYLKKYEFELPSLEKQRKLAKILWAAEETKQAYKKLLQKTDDMVKAKFEEMFKEYPRERFGNLCSTHARIGWQRLTKEEFLDEGDYYLVTGWDIMPDHTVSFEKCKYVTKDRYEQDQKLILKKNDVLLTKDGTLGKVAIIKEMDKPATLNGHIFVIRPKDDRIIPDLLIGIFTSNDFISQMENNKTGSTIVGITQKAILEFQIPSAPVEVQQRFVDFMYQIDKSKQQLQKSLDSLNAMMRALVNQSFN